MPEMRKDPLTGKWVISAPERANRPGIQKAEGFTHPPNLPHHHECHFCYGNERTTPTEVLAYGRKDDLPNTPGWELRVVSNKFPAVDTKKHFYVNDDNSFEVCSYAEGISEVIIETPHHSKNMAHYSLKETELVLNSYKDRYIALSEEKHIKYVLIFKNHGKKAGASISHSHSQIIGIPVIAPSVEQEIARAKKHYKKNCTCIYCDMIEMELKEKSRLVYENEEFVAFIPYAARSPFETWILPKFHSDSFEKLTDSQIKNLAKAWKNVLYKLHEALENVPYNYYIHTSPVREDTENFYHQHVEIIPKTSTLGGFELGTGMYINISTPEKNAKILREIKVK